MEPVSYVPLPVPIDQHGMVSSVLRRVSQTSRSLMRFLMVNEPAY